MDFAGQGGTSSQSGGRRSGGWGQEGQELPEKKLELTVYAVFPLDGHKFHTFGNVEPKVNRLISTANMEIVHKRPFGQRATGAGSTIQEYGNMYNPFWTARMVRDDTPYDKFVVREQMRLSVHN